MISLNMQDLDVIFNLLWKERNDPSYFTSEEEVKQCNKTLDKISTISNMRFEQREGDILIPITREHREKY